MTWFLLILALLFSCGAAPGVNPHHHGTERGSALIHPADHACDTSDFQHGDMCEVTEGIFKGMAVKVLEKSPSGRTHCHVLVGFWDPHIDVLSVIGVFEIELLRKLP